MLIKIQGVLQLHFQFKKVEYLNDLLENEANTVRSIIENEKRKRALPLQFDIIEGDVSGGNQDISRG